jgi:hypothetical protein
VGVHHIWLRITVYNSAVSPSLSHLCVSLTYGIYVINACCAAASESESEMSLDMTISAKWTYMKCSKNL